MNKLIALAAMVFVIGVFLLVGVLTTQEAMNRTTIVECPAYTATFTSRSSMFSIRSEVKNYADANGCRIR